MIEQESGFDSEKIHAAGWRQGSLLSTDVMAEKDCPCHKDDLVILVSQDCDILHRKLEAEPYIEVLLARSLEQQGREPDQCNYNGRNPRKFLFQMEEPYRYYEIAIAERYFLDRRLLVNNNPVGKLSKSCVTSIGRWLANRYIRSAFPDEFINRIKKACPKGNFAAYTRKHLKADNLTKDIVDFYISVQDAELAEDNVYDIVFYIVAEKESYEDAAKRDKLNRFSNDLESHLNKEGTGIDALCRVVSPREFTLHEINSSKRLDYYEDFSQ
ncbi:MAG: hypothetical protein Q4G68_02380 [Planctomycetia bacterium]|nr:hypothetical protein [Planctomycetia bacterium]